MRSPIRRLPDRPARGAFVVAALFALAACGSPAATNPPAGATIVPPAATTSGGEQTDAAPVAGEPCSFLTSEEAAVILGAAPVAIEERVGRGDCDYWLDAAKTSKANIGVFTGAEALTLFEGTKALGEPAAVPNLGDEAYMLVLESLGTIVMARTGDSVVSAQLLSNGDSAEEAVRAISLARTVVEGL
jgi:hypothetical protein